MLTMTRLRALLPALLLLLTACTAPSPVAPTPTPLPRTFQGELAYRWVVSQCDYGPRITGGEAARQARAEIEAALKAEGWTVIEQPFTYRGVDAVNVLAWKGEGEAVMIGAHYDSRRAADQEDPSQPVLGADDGASGVAVLLELARALDFPPVERRVYLAFFDAEDNGELDGWSWIVGSRWMAQHWGESGEPPLTAMVLVDMVGDADQRFYYERNSDPALQARLWQIAADLGYGEHFIPQYKYGMLDDHIPFAQRGIPAVDIIDFDYPYWHTTQDTPDKVEPMSLERVGRVLEVWLEGTP